MAWNEGYQVWLTESQSMQNAQLVANHFKGSDWSKESIAALVGNMRHESSINPNMYEYGYDWSADRGFGLVQWTPRSKYWDWATARNLPQRSGDSQLDRIDYEVENNIQWIKTSKAYNLTFAQFRSNSEGLTVNQLTEAFTWGYERPLASAGAESMPERQAFARKALAELDWTGTGGGGSKPALPVNAGTPITSQFGMRTHPITGEQKMHNGTDFGGQNNDPIFATMDGTVYQKGFDDSRGNYVIIKHTTDNYYSTYMHMNSSSVSNGQTITKGQQIGLMGTTGSSTGIHLHFAISTSPTSGYIDPEPYLATSTGGGGTDPNPPSGTTRPILDNAATPQHKYETEGTLDNMTYYKVKAGDTLSQIASKNKVSMSEILKVKYAVILNKNELKVGEVLLLPNSSKYAPTSASPKIYTVKSGDYLGKIATILNTTEKNLIAKNKLKNPHLIYVGQKLVY